METDSNAISEEANPNLKISSERRTWKVKNPFKMYIEYRTKKRLEKERILLLREEQMMEDLERFLMEIEERRCWSAYQLNNINLHRMVKKETMAKIDRKLKEKERLEQEQNMKEDGLSYFQGLVQSYKRWQFSPAKHLDFKGHKGPVVSCRLSSSLNFLLSCSEDKTLKIWNMTTGDCLKTLTGHIKVVNDGDFHPNFKMYSKDPCIISASGDGTIRIWNSSDTWPKVTVMGHDKAVYRVVFAPDGKSFVSCSEDKSIRTWCFPEGFNLFIYRAHSSPVISLSYSSSGRYFVSGSDYGERKILLWDAKYPKFKGPSQFPHILFWTPEGLVRKILIKKTVPMQGFWLQQGELGLLKDEEQFDIWIGEMSDDEREEEEEKEEEKKDADDSDSDEDDKLSPEQEKANSYQTLIKDDVREKKGATLSLTTISMQGEKMIAKEYYPGGYVYLKFQSMELPVEEAFLTVAQKESRVDIYTEKSGRKVGNFQPSTPIPWLPTIMAVDAHGKPKPYREAPPCFTESSDMYSLMFKDIQDEESVVRNAVAAAENENADNGEIIETEFEVAWHCPEANLGNLVFIVNFKFRDTKEWHQLKYSLQESPIRIQSGLTGGGKASENENNHKDEEFPFDQIERHRLLFQYVREREWNSVATFFEKKSLAFVSDRIVRKRFKIINMLIELFDECEWIILHTPLMFKPGVTKSALLTDVSYSSIEDLEGVFGTPVVAGDQDEGGEDETAEHEEVVPEKETPHEEEKQIKRINDVVVIPIPEVENEESSGYESQQATSDAVVNQNSLEDKSQEEISEIKSEHLAIGDDKSDFSELVNLAQRPTAGHLHLPQMIIAGKIEGKEFERMVEMIAERETDRLIQAEENQLAIGKELGMSTINPEFLQQIKSCAPSIDWLQSVDIPFIMHALDQVQSQKKQTVMKALRKQEEDWLELNTATMKNPFIKTGKYGAEIEEFSMPLPPSFPNRAGHARYALQAPIQMYEEILRKRKVVALPTSLEEVYEPSAQEQIRNYYRKLTKYDQKKYRSQILQIFKQYYALKLVEEKTYISRRRRSYLSLPGLTNHYPNPNYTIPAVIPKNMDFQRKPKPTELSYFDKLFGKTVIHTNVVPPVGRKPTPKQILKIQEMLNASYNATIGSKEMKVIEETFQAKAEDKDNTTVEEIVKPMTPNTVISQPETHVVPPVGAKKGKKKLTKDGYPFGVYLGRRSYYPNLPGLEEFIETNKEQQTEETSEPTKEDSKYKGLVRRFRFNGFELAHHGAVNDIVFAPSETRVATAGGDGLIKIWDPRDGSYVSRLAGHQNGVMSVKYTTTEQFLISAGGDAQIIIWSLLSNSIQRQLRGHVDVVYRIAISPDCSLIVSASHDQTLKSWHTTPRHPDAPQPPRVIKITDTTVLISWTAPPCFNCDVTAFHYQYRVGLRGEWTPPEVGQSIPPHLRNRVIDGLIPATHYQFRMQAENLMGKSDWSLPCPLNRTEFGLPKQPPQPIICRIGKTSLLLGWFTPNPKTYGSASTLFEVQCSGNGKNFEDNVLKSIDLGNAMKLGEEIIDAFDQIKHRYDTLKDSLIKSKGYHIHTRQSEEDAKRFPISDILSDDVIFDTLERTKNIEFVFIGMEFEDLHPGQLYQFRVRGLNVAGVGPWTEPTLTTCTLSTHPEPPSRPTIQSASLRKLVFQWSPPEDDGGTAITGYRVHLRNLNKYIDLPRSAVTYTWEGLFPGKSYFMKVLAKNEVGESDYSEYNEESQSFTTVAPPEKPTNPIAIEGNWNSVTFEVDIPYHNGAAVKTMEVFQRTITPFSISPWYRVNGPGKDPTIFSLVVVPTNKKQDVEIVKYVDLEEQQQVLEEMVRNLEILKAKSAFDMQKKNNNNADADVEQLINSQKPAGSRIRFVVSDLLPDSLYEIHVRFNNLAGWSEFSQPSHRAKTNKASLPGTCLPPTSIAKSIDSILLEVILPEGDGGSPIKLVVIEAMDLDHNATTVFQFHRNELDTVMTIQYRLNKLRSEGSFVFRCRAESGVGTGPFSDWSDEITLSSSEDGPAVHTS